MSQVSRYHPNQPSVLAVLGTRDDEPDTGDSDSVDQAIVDCAVYLDGRRQPGEWTPAGALERVRELRSGGGDAFLWLGLREPSEPQMAVVADVFGLHPIAVEDAVHAQQRPKVDRFDDTLFFVVKTVNYVPHESLATARRIAETGEIMVFVGAEFVVAVRHGRHSGLTGLRTALEGEPARLALGPTFVLESIVRQVVEQYLRVARALEKDIDTVEEQTFSRSGTDVEQIYVLKRDLVELRRAIGPLSAALQQTITDHVDLLPTGAGQYLADVLGQQRQAAEQITTHDETLSDLLKAAVARADLQQNLDMRAIAAWVAIAAVPTMIAGVYGMNFQDMPELQWHWGYPATLGLMATVCGSLYLTFRRNRWL